MFIGGIQILSRGMARALGRRASSALEQLTASPGRGILVGLGVTALLQSSSATTVMVVSLVDADLLTLHQAVGVIFGANIGTTVTAQLVAFDLDRLALPALLAGTALYVLAPGPRLRNWGSISLGFGLLFAGMGMMGYSLAALHSNPLLLGCLSGMSHHPLTAVPVGALVTALVQSSSAVTGMIIALARQGMVGLPEAIGLVLGSNIGTTVTAVLASLGTGTNGRRAALLHVLFNVLGVGLVLPFFPVFHHLVLLSAPDLVHQVANAHTLFNVLSVVFLLPFQSLLEELATALVSEWDR
ncbi:MAG TPA: Na/Pi cotransporter family protein [Firmicutes bacterium]|nr:Na/Pi cotransporter family protein [Bacillota bacterium]